MKGPEVDAGATGADAALEWRVVPWRERPARAAVGVLLAAGLCAAVASQRLGFVPTLALSVASVAAVAPLFASARCRIDGDGPGRRGALGWERRRWTDVRRARLTARALVLSPYARPHWLDAYRALVLPLPAGADAGWRDRLRATLERHGL